MSVEFRNWKYLMHNGIACLKCLKKERWTTTQETDQEHLSSRPAQAKSQ
jgi:hypothetical protein